MTNHIDLARDFVESSYLKGRAGGMRFEGNKAFSYDVLIARKHDGVMLINNMPYSTSTSAHRGKIRAACRSAGMSMLEVPNLYFEHEVNLQHFHMVRNDLKRRLERARVRQPIEDTLATLEATERLYMTLFPSAAIGKEAA